MKTVLMIGLLFLSVKSWAYALKPTSFQTDYCTNYPEGTLKEPELWKHCCLLHDMYFWAGGNKKDRSVSDSLLKKCIAETGSKFQANLIYLAVRAGSYSPIKYSKKKWNNGWPEREDFQSLTREDVDAIEKEIYSGYDFIPGELKAHFVDTLRSRLK